MRKSNNLLLAILIVLSICLFSVNTFSFGQESITGFLRVQKDKIVDDTGNEKILKGFFWQRAAYQLDKLWYFKAVERGEDKKKLDEYNSDILKYGFTDLDIKCFQDAGANVVRLGFALWHIEKEPYKYSEEVLRQIDNMIDKFGRSGIYVILDLHSAGQNDFSHNSEYSYYNQSLWDANSGLWDRSVKLWGFLADRYKDNPYIAGYDLINEPKAPGKKALYNFHKDVIGEIRKYDKNHILFVEIDVDKKIEYQIGGIYDDDNLAVSLHFYEPHNFTLGGAVGVHYPGIVDGKYWDKNEIDKYIAAALNLKELKNKPMFIGEFGANTDRGEEGLNWIEDTLSIMNKYKLHYTILEYKGYPSVSYVNLKGELAQSAQEYIKKLRDGILRYEEIPVEEKEKLLEPDNYELRLGLRDILKKYFLANNSETLPPRLPRYIATHFTKTSGDNTERIVFNWELRKYEERKNDIREDGYFNPYHGKDADMRWINYDKDGHPFNEAIAPAFNNYNNDITAYNAVKVEYDAYNTPKNDRNNNGIPDQIEDYENMAYKATGFHCDILNYDPRVYPLNDPSPNNRLLINHPNIQIINNIIYGSSLFTVYFPPYWNPANKYPVKLNGHGWGWDNNAEYLSRLPTNAQYAGLSVAYGNGLIIVQSNTGGREAHGSHSDAINDVGKFLEEVMPGYGADISKVAVSGASRGGRNALTWGANPAYFKYNAVAIHSFVPPIGGFNPGHPMNVFPAFIHSIQKILGSPFAVQLGDYWDLDVTPPRVMKVEDIILAVRKAAWGVETEEAALAKQPYGIFSRDDLGESLKRKRILISYGAHDSFMPMDELFEFDYLLRKKEIPARIVLGYCLGHGTYDLTGDAEETLFNLVQGKEIKPFMGNTKVFYMPKALINDGTGTDRKRYGYVQINEALIKQVRLIKGRQGYFNPDHDVLQLGFSATIPFAVGQGLSTGIILNGEKGKKWEFVIRKENGYYPVYQNSGIFGQSIALPDDDNDEKAFGDEYIILNFNAGWEPGTYEWFFKYDGKEIPNRFTPFVSPAYADNFSKPAKAIIIVKKEPPVHHSEYRHPYAADNDSITNGIDQYHPLLLQENNSPVFMADLISDISVIAGETIQMVFRATDLDGDQLVYDLRNTVTSELLKRVEFNGLSGDFSWKTTNEDVGEYLIKAIAKDGKGGIVEEDFRVEIKDGLPDTTPPTTPKVTDAVITTASTTTLSASWLSTDPESGIAEYEYAIGTSLKDIIARAVTKETSITHNGLKLVPGKTYYFTVRAKNNSGLWSEAGNSDGITVIALSASTTNIELTITKNYSGSLTIVPALKITNKNSDLPLSWKLEDNKDAVYIPQGGVPQKVPATGFGIYKSDLTGTLFGGNSQTLRAYIDNNKPVGIYKGSYTVKQQLYGDKEVVIGKLSYSLNVKEGIPLTPYIKSLAPYDVKAGTILTLKGKNFGNRATTSRVRIKNNQTKIELDGNVVSWSNDIIVVKVPYFKQTNPYLSGASCDVKVITGKKESNKVKCMYWYR